MRYFFRFFSICLVLSLLSCSYRGFLHRKYTAGNYFAFRKYHSQGKSISSSTKVTVIENKKTSISSICHKSESHSKQDEACPLNDKEQASIAKINIPKSQEPLFKTTYVKNKLQIRSKLGLQKSPGNSSGTKSFFSFILAAICFLILESFSFTVGATIPTGVFLLIVLLDLIGIFFSILAIVSGLKALNSGGFNSVLAVISICGGVAFILLGILGFLFVITLI